MAFAIAAGLLLSGCATLMNGRTQQVALDTTPTGAVCDVGGIRLRTPGVVTLSRDADFYAVSCALDGYATASSKFTVHFDDLGDFLFGNILVGGVLPGMLIDSQGGAYSVIPNKMNLTMVPVDGQEKK
jgi:hypothetical protein